MAKALGQTITVTLLLGTARYNKPPANNRSKLSVLEQASL